MNELMTVLHISTIFACIFHHEIYLHFTFHREMYTYKYTYKRNQTTLDGILMICALSCSQFAQFVHLFSVNNMTTWKRVNTGRAREAKIEGESEKSPNLFENDFAIRISEWQEGGHRYEKLQMKWDEQQRRRTAQILHTALVRCSLFQLHFHLNANNFNLIAQNYYTHNQITHRHLQ